MNTTITLGQVYSYKYGTNLTYKVIKSNRRTVIVECLTPTSDGVFVQLGMWPSQFKTAFKLLS